MGYYYKGLNKGGYCKPRSGFIAYRSRGLDTTIPYTGRGFVWCVASDTMARNEIEKF